MHRYFVSPSLHREFHNLLLYLNDELEDSALYDKSLVPSHTLSTMEYYDGGDWSPAPSFILTVKRMKADNVPLASLCDESVYDTHDHLQSAQAAYKTPGYTLPVITAPLSNIDSVGAIWSIDDSHHGHIELKLLLSMLSDALHRSRLRPISELIISTYRFIYRVCLNSGMII